MFNDIFIRKLYCRILKFSILIPEKQSELKTQNIPEKYSSLEQQKLAVLICAKDCNEST